MNILVTSAGRRVALVASLRDDAAALGVAGKIIAADASPARSAACGLAAESFAVPPCADPGYADAVLSACDQRRVRMVVPTIDTELLPLAIAQGRFASAGVSLVVSSPEAVRIARDKLRTAEILSAAGVPTPRTAPLSDVVSGKAAVGFPAVFKRLDGSRSIGLHFVASAQDIPGIKVDATQYVAQERCVGPEYTVNCYVDRSGVLRAAVPHRRIEVRDGEVSKGVTERRADLSTIAGQIVKAIPGLRGPFCFQAILTAEGPKVFEINARLGGGYPLAHAAGATFGKWLIEEALGLPCTANDVWHDGLLMLRYDAAVFIKQ